MTDLGKRRLAPAHRVAVTVLTEQEGLAVDRHQRIEVGVFCGANEVDRAIPQFFELFLFEGRPQQHVGKQLDHQAGIAREEGSGNRYGLEVGTAAEVTAGRVDCLCKLRGVAIPRTFLEQRRKQVRKPAVLRRIDHRATAQNRRYRYQRHFGLLAREQHGAVVELEPVERRQRDPLRECGASQEREQQGRDAIARAAGDHSSSSAAGALKTPIVALLR